MCVYFILFAVFAGEKKHVPFVNWLISASTVTPMSQVAGSTQNQLRQWHLNQLYWLCSKSATLVALKISYISGIQISCRLHSKSAALVALKISNISGTQISCWLHSKLATSVALKSATSVSGLAALLGITID